MTDDLPTPELDPLEWTGLDAGQRTLRAQIAAQSRWAKPGNRKRWKASPTSGRSLFRLQATEAPEVVAE